MKNVHIVLIEDNAADVQLVKLALEENGIPHTITLFSTGIGAVQVLSSPENTLRPDAILFDLNTPGTDGFEAFLKLRQNPRLAQVPMAILTSSRARVDKHRAAIHGARFVEKPSQLQDFLNTVGRLVKDLVATA